MVIPHDFSSKGRASLRALLDGNKRFVAGAPTYSRDISSARAASGPQRPIAAVFTCVDSRVTAESLFDCDFGQLIVVRTAAHVPDRAAVGSLQFAVDQLAVPLVVVLGHERCGAIQLSVDTLRDDPRADNVGYLVDSLREPSVNALTDNNTDPYTAAMRSQITATVETLRTSKVLSQTNIVGARYDLDNGTVHIA